MSISKWDLMAPTPRLCSLDGILTTFNIGNGYNCGLLYTGGSKSALRRPVFAYDLNAPPAVGSPLIGGELISNAYIEGYCTNVTGAVSQPAFCTRVTRSDWVKTEATWIKYRAGVSPIGDWTVAGGDVDDVTPARVSWTTPAAIGAFTIAGLLAHVNDALLLRSGIVNLLLRLSTETNDDIQRFHSARSSDPSIPAENLRLVLDYQDGDAPVPQQVEGSQGRVMIRPEYDHLADQRSSPVGEFLREIKGADRMIERSLRA